MQENTTLHITVSDSGDGLTLTSDDAFTEGVSTKDSSGAPGGRGVGLALSRQIARTHGGDIRIADTGGRPGPENPRGGAIFLAQIPGTLR